MPGRASKVSRRNKELKKQREIEQQILRLKAEASASAAQARILEEARKAQSETQAQPHAAAQVVAAPATPAEPPRQVHVARPPPPPEPEVPVTARSFYPEVAASLKMALVNGAHSVAVVVAGPGEEEAEQSGVTWGTVEDNETLEKHYVSVDDRDDGPGSSSFRPSPIYFPPVLAQQQELPVAPPPAILDDPRELSSKASRPNAFPIFYIEAANAFRGGSSLSHGTATPGRFAEFKIMEERYKLMMHLMMKQTTQKKHFVYTGVKPVEGARGTVMVVQGMRNDGAGAASLTGRGMHHVKLIEVWKEEGQFGLFWAIAVEMRAHQGCACVIA